MKGFWNKIGFVGLVTILLCISLKLAYGLNAPTGFVVTAGDNPKTDLNIAFDALDSLNQANGDTMSVRNAADSSVVFQFDYLAAAAVDTNISGFIPFTSYELIFSVDSLAWESEGGKSMVICADSTTIVTENIDRNRTTPSRSQLMRKASSALYQTTVYDTTGIAITAEGDAESTMVYDCAKWTNIYGYTASDSANFSVLIYAGYFGDDALDSDDADMTLTDSLLVTTTGNFTFADGIDFGGVKQHFYAVLEGDADCGWNTVYLYLGRDE